MYEVLTVTVTLLLALRHPPHHCSPAGAANAGIPLSIIVKEYGWTAYFNTLIAACFLALLLLSPMTNLRSFVQRREIYRQKKLKDGGL
jgi:hypothetical protein